MWKLWSIGKMPSWCTLLHHPLFRKIILQLSRSCRQHKKTRRPSVGLRASALTRAAWRLLQTSTARFTLPLLHSLRTLCCVELCHSASTALPCRPCTAYRRAKLYFTKTAQPISKCSQWMCSTGCFAVPHKILDVCPFCCEKFSFQLYLTTKHLSLIWNGSMQAASLSVCFALQFCFSQISYSFEISDKNSNTGEWIPWRFNWWRIRQNTITFLQVGWVSDNTWSDFCWFCLLLSFELT